MIQSNPRNIQILELGCGQAIPTRSFVGELRRIDYSGNISATLQDLDTRTIENVTKPAMRDSSYRNERVHCEYVVRSWDKLIFSSSFQVILSSECVYREDLFESHANVIEQSLSKDGVCIVAGKRYYFGCGGGTMAFADYIGNHFPQFKVSLEETFENGMSNTREIISIVRKA